MRCARLCLLLARFAISAWVGAAALFVVTGVREVTADEIPPVVRNALTTIRFPAYYAFGFVLVGATVLLLGLAVIGVPPEQRRRSRESWRLLVTGALLLVALLLMGIDYVHIYQPLEAMMQARDQAIPAMFHQLHQWSKWINFASVLVCLVAALRVCGTQPLLEAATETVDQSPPGS